MFPLPSGSATTRWLTLLGATAATCALASPDRALAAAPIVTPKSVELIDAKDLWRNPIFRKQLLGSFGINSEIEPPLADEEQEFFAEVTGQIADDPKGARTRILAYLRENEKASALFDFNAANIYFNEGNKQRAALLFKAALKKFSDFRRAHQNLAMLYVGANRHELAIKHFSEAIRLGAEDGTIFGLLGGSYAFTENFAPAESAFRNAILLQPEVKEWRLGLAQSLLMQEQYGSAAAIIGKMIEADPLNKNLWIMQAGAYIGGRENLKAAANYEFLDSIGALDSTNCKLLGDIYLNEEMLTLAGESYLRSFANDDTQDAATVIRAAEILLLRGGAGEAATLLEGVESMAGDRANDNQSALLRLRAKLALDAGRGDEGARLLERALDLSPLDGKAILMYGDYFKSEDQLDRAILVYERALDIGGSEADSRTRLAQAYVQKEDFKKAITLLQQAQEKERRDSVARYLEELQAFVKRRGG